jgi:hypothetical protein
MKKGEMWDRWVETKGRSEYECACLAPADEISTRGSESIKAGQKSSTKRHRKPTMTATATTKKEQPKDDASPSVTCARPKLSTSKQCHNTPAANNTNNESSFCSSSQSDFSGNDASSNDNGANGVNGDAMFLLTGADIDSEEERQICEWNSRNKIKNNNEKIKALFKRYY